MLPAQTYIKGFLRTYAEYLGLDGQLYVDEFNSRFVADGLDDDAAPRRAARPPGPRHRAQGARARPRRHRGADGARDRRLEVRRRRPGDADAAGGTADAARGRAPCGTASTLTGVQHGHVRRGPSRLVERRGAPPGDARQGRSERIDGHALLALRPPGPAGVRVATRRQGGRAAGAHEPEGARHADPHGPRGRLSRPRAVIVVTGSELVRGERTDLNGPFLAARGAPARARAGAHRDRRRRAEELEAALRAGARRRRVPRLGRARPDARRPHGRDGREGARRRPARRPGARGADRGGVARGRRAAEARLRRLRAGRDEAGDDPRRRDLARARGHGARARDRRTATGRSSSSCPGPPSRAPAALAARARDGRVRARSSPRPPARSPRHAPLRRQRVGSRARARRGGRRRRRGGGDDLRARLRDPRRPRRRAGRRGARRRARGGASCRRSSSGSTRRDEAPIEAHVLELCRERGWTLGDGRVVHRRARRGAADGHPRVERRLPRRRRGVRERGQGGRSSASPRSCSPSTARCRPRWPRRWRRAPARGSAPTSPSR